MVLKIEKDQQGCTFPGNIPPQIVHHLGSGDTVVLGGVALFLKYQVSKEYPDILPSMNVPSSITVAN